MRASRSGVVGICTSIITLAEISYIQGFEPRNGYRLTDSVINSLLLDQDAVQLIPPLEQIALRARELTRPLPGRRERLDVLDAIHAATAEAASVDFLASYDRDFEFASERVDVPVGATDPSLIP